ncbi:hypothetical protein PICST_52710 [Scheffersomyces stipitis CBS 6054]|uniref:Uncharacterized protein n=1 Tax=Scheffersomyces stipitis (strain ATCC 58785 / CBS 6054 / NBRC 10063 / NRRL Y-11545) TaxID=322104 RepID=A3GH00_PICST|nr:predicted protein [Scheffersomyces stipitis CBS 6054]EAZ63622.2 hypothetical protein PICST_52710 [Scheffersomyces stipitis CBS 6054]
MGTFSYNDSSIEGDVYVQRLSTYIRRNEEALANGLLCFSRNHNTHIKVKPLRLSFTIHHLYYITERIESSPLGVDVGPLNIKLDNPNHEPTFISFMANNARSSRHFDSDTRSISSINSMKSIVSSASVYWRSFAFSKDPKVINKDIKYLYSSFTKIPCLILTPKTKIASISSYEEYPCDTSVPVKMFKNLQVLEIVDYDPNEIFGWHILSEQLRILIIRNSKISNISEVLHNLVIDDESGRSSFNSHKQQKNSGTSLTTTADDSFSNISEVNEFPQFQNNAFRYNRRERATTASGAGSLPKDVFLPDNLASSSLVNKDYHRLPDSKWSFLKQLTVSETSITSVPSFIFKSLTSLVKLNLSNNLLDEVPEGLDTLVNLKYLNFADNYITDLKKLPKNLVHLSTLNFNNNKLTDLTGLENLHTLEKIDLRRNNLADIKSLKPIVLQFIKNPNTFNNVYLSSNKLPKSFRIDLFNLFNGVKYKNGIKIDDSRPGYFESALLLDAENAFKNLERFFSESISSSVKNQSQPVPPPTGSLIKNSAATTDRIQSTTNTIETLMEPFSSMKVSNDEDTPTKKKFDLSHTVLSSAPTIVPPDAISVSSIQKAPSSPLSANTNLTNKLEAATAYTSKPSLMGLHLNNSNASIPGSPSNLKKSTTLAQLDLETVQNAAPNIVTQVQVTARMST